MYEAATENIVDRYLKRRIIQVLRLRKKQVIIICHSNCILWGKKTAIAFCREKNQ